MLAVFLAVAWKTEGLEVGGTEHIVSRNTVLNSRSGAQPRHRIPDITFFNEVRHTCLSLFERGPN